MKKLNNQRQQPRKGAAIMRWATFGMLPALLATSAVITVLLILPTTASAQTLGTDATLSGITVSGRTVLNFAASRTSYHHGVGSTVTQVTIVATTTDPDASWAVTSPSDADTGTPGHQVNLSPARNMVTLRGTAEDTTTTQDYTLSVNRGVTDAFGWKAVDDLDGLIPTSAFGIWSNGTTMWVGTFRDDKIYAYDLSTGTRDSGKDFNTLAAAGNNSPFGIWSDGTTMWVADVDASKIYAYNLSTKARDSGQDFNTLDAAGNRDPGGLWSDGTTMWVVDIGRDKVYAYNLSTKLRDNAKDIDLCCTEDPQGIWSDGFTLWVVDGSLFTLDAYYLANGDRDSSREFNTLDAAGTTFPRGLWSDGETMWVADYKIYSYNSLLLRS